MPEDIRRKRLAGNLLVMAQAGQYNFTRCLRHGEPQAALLAAHEFVTAAMKVHFLLEGRYMPFYKWSFRALRETEDGQILADQLSRLLVGDNADPQTAEKTYNLIEEVASDTITRLQDQGLTKAVCGDLEKHAYSVNDGIRDGDIRNRHILSAI